MQKRHIELYCLIFQCLIILLGYIVLYHRIQFGIDFSDEAWYVAEPYIVAEGAIPFVNNWTQASGFTLPLAYLFKLYVLITGGTEGIVLYSRILYSVAALIVYVFSVFVIAKRTKQGGMLIAVFPLLFTPMYSLYDLSYNTIGVMYLFLTCVLLFFGVNWENYDNNLNKVITVFSGIIMARAIIATPCVLAAWAGILLVLVGKKKWQLLRCFFLGNVVTAIMVIGWCCINGGVGGFLNGMRVFLTEQVYLQIQPFHTPIDDIRYIFRYCTPLWGALVAVVILRKLFKKDKYYEKGVVGVCILCLVAGIAAGVKSHMGISVVRYGWFEVILMSIFLKNIDQQKRKIMVKFAWIAVFYLIVYLCTSVTNIYGFGSREYWLVIPTVLGCLSWYFVMGNGLLVTTAVFAINLFLGCLLVGQNYGYVYRDQPITKLTAKVDSGIWKGCYTTSERAENVKMLEEYIRSITDANDKVLFMDWVSFAYLMTDAKACTPSSLDVSWSYHVDNSIIMKEYFESVDKIPDKIIYIDYGRDEKLSIDGKHNFNQFVNDNYELIEVYDTNSKIVNKHAVGDYAERASFFVKYYKKI